MAACWTTPRSSLCWPPSGNDRLTGRGAGSSPIWFPARKPPQPDFQRRTVRNRSGHTWPRSSRPWWARRERPTADRPRRARGAPSALGRCRHQTRDPARVAHGFRRPAQVAGRRRRPLLALRRVSFACRDRTVAPEGHVTAHTHDRAAGSRGRGTRPTKYASALHPRDTVGSSRSALGLGYRHGSADSPVVGAPPEPEHLAPRCDSRAGNSAGRDASRRGLRRPRLAAGREDAREGRGQTLGGRVS